MESLLTATPLVRLLTRQQGLVTLAQAAEVGIGPRAVSRRHTTGAWRRTAPRVYQVYGDRAAPHVRVWRAALWSDGVVAGMAAGWLHGMVDRPGPWIDVTVPRARNPGRLDDVRVRRRDLDHADLARRQGIPVLAAPLAALELAIRLPDGPMLLDRALRRAVRFDDLLAAYRRAMGSAGSGRMRTLVVAAAERADSQAERLFFRILRDAGLDGWVRNMPFGRWLVDVAFVGRRVAVEIDGWAWHVDPERFREDRRKQNALVAAGWTILRFTWHDVAGEPRDVAARVRHALTRP